MHILTFIKELKGWGEAETKQKTIPWQILHTLGHIYIFYYIVGYNYRAKL